MSTVSLDIKEKELLKWFPRTSDLFHLLKLSSPKICIICQILKSDIKAMKDLRSFQDQVVRLERFEREMSRTGLLH
jgi:hypothetical protein